MTRHQFRLLVVTNQLLLFGGFFVADLTDHLLPAELQSYPAAGASVFGDNHSYTFADWAFYGVNLATLAGAVGLCLGHRWGRTLYLAGFIGATLSSLLWPFTVSTSWTGIVFTLYGATEGMILALAYFSHLKRMFEDTHDEPDEQEDGET